MNIFVRRHSGPLGYWISSRLHVMFLWFATWVAKLGKRRDVSGRLLGNVKIKVSPNSGRTLRFWFRVDSRSDRGVIGQIFHDGDYRVDQWCQGRALLRYAQPRPDGKHWLIVDAGANIGAASLYLDAVFPGCTIVAIEPEPNNCQLMRLNCAKSNFKLVESALGRESGTLYLRDLGRSDWGFQVGTEGHYPVPVVTMADILERQAPDAVPLILKIDIEGAEQLLFSETSDWLNYFALVVIELHDWMQPGDAISRVFYREISRFDFDILQHAENTFCFNNRLLREHYGRSGDGCEAERS